MHSQHRLTLLATYLRPQRARVALLALLLVGSVAIQTGNPEILRGFIDSAIAGGALPTLLLMGALFLGLGLLNQVFVVATAYVSGNLGWRTTNRMRLDLVQHCLSLDMAFHHTRTPGELIERADEDVTALANLFSAFVLQILVNLLLLLCVLVVLFLTNRWLGLALSLYALLVLAVLYRTRNVASPAWEAASQAQAELHGFLGEQTSGIADIRTSGAIAYVLRGFYEKRRNKFLKVWQAHRLSTLLSGGTDLLITAGTVGAFILGAALFQAGAITLGTVYLVVTYTQLLAQPLQELMGQIDDLQHAGASLARVQALFAIQPTLQDGPGADLPSGALAVAFEDVTFGYQEDAPVLEGITLHVKPGEVLGILGRTGSGKTTLARLLTRLYDPCSGTICLGGSDLREARLTQLRARIGMVTQEVQLFHASLRDNLTLFDPTIPDERIVQILNDLGLASWYEALPNGLATLIAAGEMGFSAGEAQLLAFARVFLQNPAVVILDEASSRLDPATERLIEREVDRLLAGRTGIIIAHRLSTIERANSLAILEQGRVREYGSREQLLHDPNSRLNQLLNIDTEEVLA